MSEKLSLPSRFDTASVDEFVAALMQQRHRPVTIDGARVSIAGTLAIQALVSGARQWAEDGMEFRVVAPSEALLESCHVLGIAPMEIGAEEPFREACQ